MKKIFWIFFITCLVGSSVNLAYIYSKKLSNPYLFDDVRFDTHRDYPYDTISLPYLTNNFDNTHIQYINLDQHFLYPQQNTFHFFQQALPNPQLHEKYYLYNLNFDGIDWQITKYKQNNLIGKKKTIYDAKNFQLNDIFPSKFFL